MLIMSWFPTAPVTPGQAPPGEDLVRGSHSWELRYWARWCGNCSAGSSWALVRRCTWWGAVRGAPGSSSTWTPSPGWCGVWAVVSECEVSWTVAGSWTMIPTLMTALLLHHSTRLSPSLLELISGVLGFLMRVLNTTQARSGNVSLATESTQPSAVSVLMMLNYSLNLLVSAPVFFFQWQFDEAQMTVDNVGAPVTQAQWNFIHHQGRNIRKTLESVSAVFSPSCISHTVITKPDWAGVEVNGVSLPDALQCWVSQTQPGEHELDQSNYEPHPVQSDSPHDQRRINSNMLKALNHDPLSSRHRLRHKEGLVLDNRTNKRMRKNRRRYRRRCRQSDSLEARIRCAQEENKERMRVSQSSASYLYQKDQPQEDRRRGMLRSLSKRTDDQERQRRKRRRRRRHRSEGEGGRRLSKEERRRLRREEKRRQKIALKKQRRRERKSLKLRHKKGRITDYSGRQEKSLSVRSIQMRSAPPALKCPQKHVDTCSWPQCNRSCPKLRNPLTGK